MGAAVSTNVSTIRNNLTESAYQSCPNIGTANSATLSGVTYTTPQWCPAGSPGFEIDQTATVDANCVIGSMQKSIADSASALSANAQTGLGFAVSTDKSKTEQNIQTYLTQTCGNQNASNTVDFKNVNVEACTFRVLQNASDKSVCQLSALQDQASKVATNEAASATGWFGGGFGIMGIVLVLILVCVLIGGGFAAYRYFSSKKGKTSTGTKKKTPTTIKKITPGEETFDLESEEAVQIGGLTDLFSGAEGTFWERVKRNKSLVIIVILLLLLITVYFFNKRIQNKPPITEEDLDNLKQKIMEAQQVASMDNTYVPSAPPSPQYTIATQDEIIGNNYDARYSDHAYNQTLDDYYKPLLE